jgi:hypothetical protein
MKKNNKRNFSAQPPGGGMIDTYTGLDLVTEIKSSDFKKDNFQKRPLFVDNCKNCGSSFKNANGDEYSYGQYENPSAPSGSNIFGTGLSWGQLFGTAANIYSQEQQQQILQQTQQVQQGQSQLNQQKLREQQAALEAQKAKARIWIPVTIGISVLLVGFGAYYIFKKKKA